MLGVKGDGCRRLLTLDTPSGRASVAKARAQLDDTFWDGTRILTRKPTPLRGYGNKQVEEPPLHGLSHLPHSLTPPRLRSLTSSRESSCPVTSTSPLIGIDVIRTTHQPTFVSLTWRRGPRAESVSTS